MRKQRAYKDHFDDAGKQLAPLPPGWMDLSRFKVGDKLEFLEERRIHIPSAECKASESFHYNAANLDKCEHRQMRGMVGEVVKVNNGDDRFFPSRWVNDDSFEEGGVYLTQRRGWLTVQFEVSPFRDKAGKYQPIALHPDEEGATWRRVSKEKVSP